jgi:tRNA threonylcarbamoyladenosine biosynthesis protein TsaB
MKLLAIDCSTQACSVALLADGMLLSEQFEVGVRQHTQRLLPMVDSLLTQTQISLSQLDAIAFGRGPGSFTGLRICLGAVQGLAFGADLPVLPISTLAALAQTAVADNNIPVTPNSRILSMIDARMDEIYWAQYTVNKGLVEIDGEERLSVPEQLLLPTMPGSNNIPYLAVGSGWNYADRISFRERVSKADGGLLPRASAIALLAEGDCREGRWCSPDEARPCYLRDELAWQKQV